MNYKLASMSLALAGALVFASVGYAQTPNGQPQTAGVQQMPPATNGTAQMPPNNGIDNGINNGGSRAGAAMTDFSRVAGNKGYITRQDANNDPWLKDRFDQCDTNQDGRIDRTEFNHCRQQAQQDQNTMGNEPAAGSTS